MSLIAPNPIEPSNDVGSLATIARTLVRTERKLVDLEQSMRGAINRTAQDRRASARNLVHYVALRHQDLRGLQSQLSQKGLSSLGRSESCVMESLLQVSERAHESLALHGDSDAERELSRLSKQRGDALSWEQANLRLHEHTHEILGPKPDGRHIYVMVTAPSAKEADREWIVKMLTAGMNVLRINCVHEGEVEWGQMIRALRAARAQTGRQCRVLMDLAGPKIRTGSIGCAHRTVTWKPVKNELGNIVAPAQILIRRASSPPQPGTALALTIADETFSKLRKGDELRFRDARRKKLVLVIDHVAGSNLVGLSTTHAYVLDGGTAVLHRGKTRVGRVAFLASDAAGAFIDVKVGDRLVLTKRVCEGTSPRRDQDGRVERPGVVACTLPAALQHLAAGHRVLFDDGKIQAVTESTTRGGQDYLLRIVRTAKETVKLRAEKGINLPDTPVTVPSLTVEDRRALKFVARHADAVSLSFVRRVEDLRLLNVALDRLKRPNLGIVLKIETRAGFEHLPAMLLEGLRKRPLAVMIARGDLAVEAGFERLAELQEEILWLCEAAHVPAIWATQVLDTLARTGVPSRAEVTDAAASVAAECVMLNKGPFVDQAVRVLVDILNRMEQHHYKKRSLFRKLSVSTFTERR